MRTQTKPTTRIDYDALATPKPFSLLQKKLKSELSKREKSDVPVAPKFYNPADDTDEIAKIWECLRRNDDFRESFHRSNQITSTPGVCGGRDQDLLADFESESTRRLIEGLKGVAGVDRARPRFTASSAFSALPETAKELLRKAIDIRGHTVLEIGGDQKAREYFGYIEHVGNWRDLSHEERRFVQRTYSQIARAIASGMQIFAVPRAEDPPHKQQIREKFDALLASPMAAKRASATRNTTFLGNYEQWRIFLHYEYFLGVRRFADADARAAAAAIELAEDDEVLRRLLAGAKQSSEVLTEYRSEICNRKGDLYPRIEAIQDAIRYSFQFGHSRFFLADGAIP